MPLDEEVFWVIFNTTDEFCRIQQHHFWECIDRTKKYCENKAAEFFKNMHLVTTEQWVKIISKAVEGLGTIYLIAPLD